MIKLNFFGDFVAPTVDQLTMDDSLTRIVRSADLNVVNLEAPAFGTDCSYPIVKTGPVLSQSKDSPKWLEAHGFDVVSIANNHMMDHTALGLLTTINAFSAIAVSGGGRWKDAYTPVVLEIDDIKVAILSVAHCEFGCLTDEWDTSVRYGIAWINHPKVDAVIQRTIRQVDYFLVFAHAGLEYAEQPLPEWRTRYRQLIDLGCSAVIASHPHVIQGVEYYKSCPIVYSLGNFYFPLGINDSPQWYRSICATLTLDDDDIRLDITPLRFEENLISVCDDDYFRKYYADVNETLCNTEKYMEYVNQKCMELERVYRTRCICSNMGRMLNWHDLTQFLRIRMREPKRLSDAHLLNSIRCETHRWCIIRAIKLKNKDIL